MKKVFMAAAIIIGFLSCKNVQQQNSQTAPDIFGKYKVVAINRANVPETMNGTTLELTDSSKYSGKTGVNSLFGDYKVSNSNISFDEGAMTRMMGDPSSMKIEQDYVEAIHSVKTFDRDGEHIILKNGKGDEVMRLVKE